MNVFSCNCVFSAQGKKNEGKMLGKELVSKERIEKAIDRFKKSLAGYKRAMLQKVGYPLNVNHKFIEKETQ